MKSKVTFSYYAIVNKRGRQIELGGSRIAMCGLCCSVVLSDYEDEHTAFHASILHSDTAGLKPLSSTGD